MYPQKAGAATDQSFRARQQARYARRAMVAQQRSIEHRMRVMGEAVTVAFCAFILAVFAIGWVMIPW